MYNDNQNDDILGIQGIQGENLHAGVGFVIIPKNVDIDEYKEDVYRSGRISIYGGYGHSNFYNILIDREVLQRIKFPSSTEGMGSPVVWINIPKHNEPIIVACLKYDEDFHSISENRKRDTKSEGGAMADWDLDGKRAKVRLTVTGNKENDGEFEININSVNNSGKFKLIVNGDILQKSFGKMIRVSQNIISDAVTNLKGVVRAKILLNPDKDAENIFEYEDDYQNKITASEEKLNFRADESSKIDFGDGKEPLTLGESLQKIMERLDDADAKMTFPTAFGPTGTRINQAEYTEIRKDFETIKSKLTNSD